MIIETVAINSLNAAVYNPRKDLQPGDKEYDKLAKSIAEFDYIDPIIWNKRSGNVCGGHQRLKILKAQGLTELDVSVVDLDDVKEKALNLALNKTGGDWDLPKLSDLLLELDTGDIDIEITGFDNDELESLLVDRVGNEGLTDDDAVPEVPDAPVTKLGDIWLLGDHRLMCGDSTDLDTVERLMAGEKADLLHADPPYGMGKEKDGVLNDNLYKEKLDAFQMSWWTACRTALVDNGSAYIWGNAKDLTRLWWLGGLKDYERLTWRNIITWDKYDKSTCKPTVIEMMRSYCNYREDCLFFMLGEQGFNNNADNYWDGWDPVRLQLEAGCKKMGWGPQDIERICGVGMYSHWFTKSQWTFIPEEHYKKLQAAAREHDAFKKEHDELKKEFYATRAFFDNTHENMTDVWQYERVQGDERHGHPTPKPVKMMERCIKSSCPESGVTLEPFGGSGSTLIACEKTNRRCRMIELDPHYCDVIVTRWQDFTGKKATHAESLIDYNDIKEVAEAAA